MARRSGVDISIDFTVAEAVRRNVEACVTAGVPLVEGTTGWNDQRNEIERIVREGMGSFVFGANFSIGVNLFYRIAAQAAELVSKFDEYETFIEEQHHSRKKDAPSGTALKLKDVVSARKMILALLLLVPATSQERIASASMALRIRYCSNTLPGLARASPLVRSWPENG